MAQRPRYDDDFRAGAVLMVEAEGYPQNKGAIARVAAHLHLHERTLRRWVKGDSNPPPGNIVHIKKLDMRAALQSEIQSILAEMTKARGDASYRDLGTVLGIIFDKLQLLNGEPTESTNQRILVEYLNDEDIVAQAATVAERHYTGV